MVQNTSAPVARLSVKAALHIFKPGTHVAMSGQTLNFSEADLAATCAAYDPAKHEAPLVVGHPQHDLPAYGWVESLRFSEGRLDATPAQVNPDFADMVAAGAFKKISASFYSPDAPQNPVPGVYYLRHVGFLGAQAPAVKGLRNPKFADAAEEGVISFEEFSPTPESTPKESTVTDEEAALLRTQAAAQTARIAELEAASAAAARAATHAAHVAFCESIALNKLTPALKPTALAVLDTLSAQPTVVEFGEGPNKVPLIDAFKKFLQALPEAVSFGEFATKERAAGGELSGAGKGGGTVDFAAPQGYSADPEQLDLLGRAQAHMAANKGVSLQAAVAAVQRGA